MCDDCLCHIIAWRAMETWEMFRRIECDGDEGSLMLMHHCL